MNIEPPNLNITLERKENWGVILLSASAVSVAISALMNVPFAKVLAASCIVGLPILWLFFFPPRAIASLIPRARLARIAVYLVLFSYLALAKGVLVPRVLAVIEHVLA